MSDAPQRYAAFVEQELKAERERQVRLDARGVAVVTTSGSFVTLLGGVSAFVATRDGYQLPILARYALVVVVTTLTLSAFFGILATIMWRYQVASGLTLSELTHRHWKDDDSLALKNIVATNVTTTKALRKGNNIKAAMLLVALWIQLVALVGLGAAVYAMVVLG